MYCRSCGCIMDENLPKCPNCEAEGGKGDLYCSNCGTVVREGAESCDKCGFVFNASSANTGLRFCPTCGITVDPEATVCSNCGGVLKTANEGPIAAAGGSVAGVFKKDLVKAIILSFITCGFYSLFWLISLTNDMNKLSGKNSDPNGTTVLLLTIVTCGIYGLYWTYKMGEKRDIAMGEKSSSSVLYLVLSLCGLTLITYCLAQDSINKIVDANK